MDPRSQSILLRTSEVQFTHHHLWLVMLKELMWFEMHQGHCMLLWKQQRKTEGPYAKLNQFEWHKSQILLTPRAQKGSLLLV